MDKMNDAHKIVEKNRKYYEKIYEFEETIKNEGINIILPIYLHPSIINKPLIPIDEENKSDEKNQNFVYFEGGAIYDKSNFTLKLKNGEKYKGKLNNNCLIKGCYEWPNGQKYSGSFNENNDFDDNKEEGGCITFSELDELKGNFKNGEIYGIIEYSSPKNKINLTCNYNSGNLNGEVNYKNEKQKYVLSGLFEDGQLEGEFHLEKYYGKKLLSIDGTLKNKQKDGNYIVKELLPHKDNFIFKGAYENDQRIGSIYIKDVDNKIEFTVDYPLDYDIIEKKIKKEIEDKRANRNKKLEQEKEFLRTKMNEEIGNLTEKINNSKNNKKLLEKKMILDLHIKDLKTNYEDVELMKSDIIRRKKGMEKSLSTLTLLKISNVKMFNLNRNNFNEIRHVVYKKNSSDFTLDNLINPKSKELETTKKILSNFDKEQLILKKEIIELEYELTEQKDLYNNLLNEIENLNEINLFELKEKQLQIYNFCEATKESNKIIKIKLDNIIENKNDILENNFDVINLKEKENTKKEYYDKIYSKKNEKRTELQDIIKNIEIKQKYNLNKRKDNCLLKKQILEENEKNKLLVAFKKRVVFEKNEINKKTRVNQNLNNKIKEQEKQISNLNTEINNLKEKINNLKNKDNVFITNIDKNK